PVARAAVTHGGAADRSRRVLSDPGVGVPGLGTGLLAGDIGTHGPRGGPAAPADAARAGRGVPDGRCARRRPDAGSAGPVAPAVQALNEGGPLGVRRPGYGGVGAGSSIVIKPG